MRMIIVIMILNDDDDKDHGDSYDDDDDEEEDYRLSNIRKSYLHTSNIYNIYPIHIL